MFGPAVGAILAKSLLWAYYNEVMMDKVPADIRYDINSKFIQLDTTHEGNNPIKQVEVVASQQNGVVTFEETSKYPYCTVNTLYCALGVFGSCECYFQKSL